MTIYVASSWRNRTQPGVVAALRAAGHTVYDFRDPPGGGGGFSWAAIDPDWKGWTTAQYLEALDLPEAEVGYANDRAGMQESEACVLVLPAGNSAHIEAGWFAGMGRELHLLLIEEQEPELMYKLATAIHRDVEALVAALARGR
jgi:hypothetical protein